MLCQLASLPPAPGGLSIRPLHPFQMLTDLNTYLNKAIPDTRLTIKKYLDVKFEYLVSGVSSLWGGKGLAPRGGSLPGGLPLSGPQGGKPDGASLGRV